MSHPAQKFRRKNPIARQQKARLFGIGAVGLLAGIAGLWHYVLGDFSRWSHSSPAGIRLPLHYEIHGLDVSKFQGKIDWPRVAAMELTDQVRFRFAFIKATEGVTLNDKTFATNWKSARQHGLRRGAYHFYVPWRDPEAQAENFIRHVQLEPGDLPPVLDIELTSLKSDERLAEELGTWLRLIEAHYGQKPLIYTNGHFYRKYVAGHLDEYPLWLADYTADDLTRYPNARILFWQHAKDGLVEGIRGRVDYNVFLSDQDDFEDICRE
jgi:lysozyme